MPRIHHVRANKDYPEIGVKRGEMYYWWKNYRSSKRRSKSKPRASDLTNSDFLGRVYSAGERLEDMTVEDNFQEIMDEILGDLSDLKDECESNLENIPADLQDSHMLNDRISELETFIGELENFEFDDPEPEHPDEEPEDKESVEYEQWEEYQSWLDDKERALEFLQGISYQGE